MREDTGIDPNDVVHIRVRDFENNYVSRLSFDALRAENERLTAEVARLREANRWIPVTERLPDLGGSMSSGQVFVTIAPYTVVCQASYSALTERWYYANGERIISDVTHWRPLPEPPEGGEE